MASKLKVWLKKDPKYDTNTDVLTYVGDKKWSVSSKLASRYKQK